MTRFGFLRLGLLPEAKLAITFSTLHGVSLGFVARGRQEGCATRETAAWGQVFRKGLDPQTPASLQLLARTVPELRLV